MNSIDAQIKALLRKKAKIEMLRQVEQKARELAENSEHEGLTDEVRAFFASAVNTEIARIEGPPGTESQKEQSAPVDASQPPTAPEPPRIRPQSSLVEFVKKYGRFGFKKVSATALNGDQVTGMVKQINFPNVLVESQHGGLIAVDPETLKLE